MNHVNETIQQVGRRVSHWAIGHGIVAAAVAVFAALAPALSAQTSPSTAGYSGPGGAGAGVSGMLGVGLPLGGEGNGVTAAVLARRPAATFNVTVGRLNSGLPQTMSIGGQAHTVPADALQAVGAVIGGASPTNVRVLTDALGKAGVPQAAANELTKSLAMLRVSGASTLAIADATRAYNAAVNSLAASAPVPPIVLAVRAALSPLVAPR